MPRKGRKRSAVRAQDAVSRAQRFRIYPTAEQAEQLERSISAARAFYNEVVSDTWGVSARKSARNPRSRHLNATSRRDGQRSR